MNRDMKNYEYGQTVCEGIKAELGYCDKNHVSIRLVNLEKNKKLLEGIPYKKWLDFAITYVIVVKKDSNGIGTVKVTNELLEKSNITVDEIHQIAMVNSPILFPVAFRSMKEAILSSLKDGINEPNLDINLNNILGSMLVENPFETEMYVLSNIQGIYGASVIFYEGILVQIAAYFKTNFYILPSSVHEVILVPDRNKKMKAEALVKMVREVNEEQVAEEERLSDNVYYYDKEIRTLYEWE